MIFRITDPDQLKNVSPDVRRQLEAHATVEGDELKLKPKPGRPRYLEEAEGRKLVKWIDALVIDHEQLGRIRVGEYFVHVPNGGARNAKEAGILQGQGVRPGWPDYALYIPRGPYLGAVGELKSLEGSKPDDAQLEILLRLERMGYKAMVWFGADDAEKQLLGYLQLGART